MANQEEKVSKVTLILAGVLLIVIGYFTTSWVIAKVKPSNEPSQIVNEGLRNPPGAISSDDSESIYGDVKKDMAPYSSKTAWKPQQQAKPFGSYTANIFPKTADKYKKYKTVSFKLLAGFTYKEGKKIPRKVTRLDKKKVTLEGFMLPLDIDPETNKVKAYYLLRDQQACCFGVAPKLNEIVVVIMDEPSGYFPDVPIRVHGQLSVGEKKTEGLVESLYRMKAEIVVPPKGINAL